MMRKKQEGREEIRGEEREREQKEVLKGLEERGELERRWMQNKE